MENNVGKLILIQALGSLQFHQPVFALFFMLSKGFSLQQFFIVESVFALVMLLMEIPTGSFSDRVSRTWSLMIASALGIPATLTMILSNSFWVIVAANAVAAVGAAFWSGTDTAMLYDSLLALKREKEFKALSGRMAWYGGWAMAISGMVGGLLAQWDVSYAWWAYFLAGLPTLFVVATLQEPPLHRGTRKRGEYVLHLRESLQQGLSGNAGYFVIYAAVVWLFFSIGYWLWQPYLKIIGLPIVWFGLLYAFMNLIGSYASKHADTMERRLGMRRSLLFIPLLLALAFLLESQITALIGVCFLALQSIASGYFGPVLNDYINIRIPSEKRATILSLKNMLTSLLFCVLSPLVGYHADLYSLQTTLLFMGGTLVLTTIVLWLLLPREQ